jgi:signal transduction histidine kinase
LAQSNIDEVGSWVAPAGGRPWRAPPRAPQLLVIEERLEEPATITEALADLGVRTRAVTCLEDATEHSSHDDLAVVLLKLEAVTPAGLTVLETMRQRSPTTVLMFFSDRPPSKLRAGKLRELGPVDYMLEPVDLDLLRTRVQTLCALRARAIHGARDAQRCRELERCVAKQRRAAALAEQRAAKEQRRIASRLAAAQRQRDELLATLAHELRNPLAPVVTGLELIRAHSGSIPEIEHARSAMERQVHHLVRLVDDLLDTSRISRGTISLRRDWLDLGQTVRHAVEPWREELRSRRQELTLELPRTPMPCHGDRVRLAQLVDNLLGNAVRHTNEGTSIQVRLIHTPTEAVLQIVDDGPGIAPELLEHVFDMFVKGQRGNGLGLGLMLVEQIARLHGGSVIARSEGHGIGTTFEVRLPLDSATEPPVETRRAVTPVPRSLRIVLIEDDRDVRETTALLLEAWGHCVHVAQTGLDGVDTVLEARPHVVLIDIGLPDIDGHTTARRIRGLMGLRQPRLVALTGFGQDDDRRLAREAGFDAHLLKPVSSDVLAATLAGVVDSD